MLVYSSRWRYWFYFVRQWVLMDIPINDIIIIFFIEPHASMLHPVFVITFWIVFMGMCSAALFSKVSGC